MTTKDRLIATLEQARDRIDSGQKRFICHALPHTEAGNRIRRYIMKSLNAGQETQWVASLEGWAASENNELMCELARDRIRARRHNLYTPRDARLRWIDAMIESVRTGKPVKGDWE